eukprot:g70734.t1
MARELRILGLGEVEVEFAGRGSGRHLRIKCASCEEAEKMVRLLRERKFFTGKVHVATGRTFREREKQRAARGGAQYVEMQRELRKQGFGYWVLDVEVDEPQGEASSGESPLAEWGGMRELEELGRRVQDGPWRVAEGSRRAQPKRRHRYQLRSSQFVKGFPLRVASHNWQGKVGVDSPGFGEWPEHYKERGWVIVGVQEHNLSSQKVEKLQVDGFAVLGKAAATYAGSRLLGGVLTLVANYLAPCATIVQAPVSHPQQLWERLSSGSATASDVFVGNGYFPQENQREESIAAYEAWQAAVSYFATKGHVVTVGDANAKLGPARIAREEGVVGPFGEIDERGRGVRSENGELLAAMLVATGLRNLSGFSQPRGDKYWWSRQENVGGRRHLLDYICVSSELAKEASFGVDEVDLDTDHKAVWAEARWHSGMHTPGKTTRMGRIPPTYGEEVGSDEEAARIEPERKARETFQYNDNLRDQFEAMAQAEEIRTETGPLDYDYTEKEVELCQENLQNHKACSPDKIKNEMLKYGGTRIMSFLVRFFNWLKSCEYTPSDWGKAIIVNIPKGGDPTDPENWRDIAILSCLGKMYLSLMAARLTAFIDQPGRLRPEQGGFRPNVVRGTRFLSLRSVCALDNKLASVLSFCSWI